LGLSVTGAPPDDSGTNQRGAEPNQEAETQLDHITALYSRDELLDGEIFCSLAEARIGIESRRRNYNAERPHDSSSYTPPAPEVIAPALTLSLSTY
jgi:hypothetical protein